MDQLRQVFLSLQQMLVDAAPRAVIGLVTIIALLIVASLVERALRAILQRVQFDQLLSQAGLDGVLSRLGLRKSLATLLPRLVYFLLLLLFARTAADAWGL
ncbi:MAG TPA: hypothetical protein PKE51_13165, partial [Gemmatimonadaceae bacterium]|nr:hypothetical protein [Gemmatimonadaceae bacterium]